MANQHIGFAWVPNSADRIIPSLAVSPQILFGFNDFRFRVHGKLPPPRAEQKTYTLGCSVLFLAMHSSSDRGSACHVRIHGGRSYEPKEQVGFQTRRNGEDWRVCLSVNLLALGRGDFAPRCPRRRRSRSGTRRTPHRSDQGCWRVGPFHRRQHIVAESPVRRITVTRWSLRRRRPFEQL